MPTDIPPPFAYRFQRWDYDDMTDDVVLPTARAVFERIVKAYPEATKLARYGDLEGIWAEGDARVSISLVSAASPFTVKVELDMAAIRREAQQMVDDDAKAQAEWLKTLTHPVTGSPWLCDYGLDYVVDQLVKERQFAWRKVDEIDWAAVEARFIDGLRILREGH